MEQLFFVRKAMLPSLDDLYLFAEIASSGGLIRGAKRLGLPKSTVSRRLAKLERDVGAKLINRNARNFEMTETGRAYAEHAQRMVDAYIEAQEFMLQQDAKPRGVLKVAMPADFAIFFLPDAIASFCKTYPDVTLDIDASPQLADIIGDRFDLAIRMGKLADSSLIAKPLTSMTRHFYANRTLLKKYGAPSTLAELAEFPFITLNAQSLAANTRASELKISLKREGLSFTPRTIIKTNSIGLTRALAIAGAGVAVLPDAMAQQPLLRVLEAVELAPVDAHFVLPQRQWLPVKTRAFMEHVQAHCKNSTR